MLSSCNDVISAEVPNSLRDIAKSIKNKERFRQLSDEEALKELTDGSDEASLKFRHFLDRHGHRGYRELDNMYPPWRDNPLPCIKTIKVILKIKFLVFQTTIPLPYRVCFPAMIHNWSRK